MNLGGFSPYVPWSRRRWWAARLILAALAGGAAVLAFLLGFLPVGALLIAGFVVWLTGSFWGERLEHGPRRKGGAS